MEKEICEENLLNAEADSFFALSFFLSSMKRNYLKGFDGVKETLALLEDLLEKSDK